MTETKNIIKKKRTLLQKIVNVFLYTGITLLLILLVLFGFSQTSTFRDLLRDEVVKIANNELNGHVSINKIDGTIFTSLVLRGTVVNMGADTLLNAGVIEVKTSPLQLFLKRIYVRKVEIADAKIAFVSDSTGTLNISKLFPPTAKDSVHSKFPFKIIAPDVKLTNVNFTMRDYNVKETKIYDNLNLHDFSIKDLNLSVTATADIANNEYDVQINNFSFTPNMKSFRLKDLSGEFVVDTTGVFINNLKILTDGTDILLKAKVNKFNLFDSTVFKNLERPEVRVELKASKFNFDDLSSFISEVNFLKGDASVEVEAEGTLKELSYKRIELSYRDTHLELKGKIQNVLNADKMNIIADFVNSRIRQSDASKLMPSFGIPEYKEYGIIKFDTLNYSGNPLNFHTTAFFRTEKGSAGVHGTLDLRKDDMQYDVEFSTRNLDLAPLTGLKTNLNSYGSIKGSGVSPERLNSSLKFYGNGTMAGSSIPDSLKFTADANNRNISYNLELRSDTTSAFINGNFDFNNKDLPSYKFTGNVKGFNIAALTSDTSLYSNLNLGFTGNGTSLNPDNMDLYMTMDLNKSKIRNVYIDSTKVIADIRSNVKGERVINIISDLADITFTGKFSVNNAVSLISKEAGSVSRCIEDKINSVLYPDSVFNRQVNTGISVKPSRKKKNILPPLPEPVDIKYYVEFKDFNLLSLFLGSNQFSVDGDLSGEFKNTGNNITLSANTNLNYLKYWESNNVFFLSNFALNLNLQNNVDSLTLNDITAGLQVTSDRIFLGSDFKNINLDLKLQGEKARLDLTGDIESSSRARVYGVVDLSDESIRLNLDTLEYVYNNLKFLNKGNVELSYSKDNIKIDRFNLARGTGELSLTGSFSRYGSQSMKLAVLNLKGADITQSLLGLAPEDAINSNINLNAKVTGNYSNPVISVQLNFDSLSFKNKRLGYLKGTLNYSDQNISINAHIIDSSAAGSKTPLLIQGNIPIDLSFNSVEERLVKSRQMEIKIEADNLDLSPLENSLPSIKKVSGKLTAGLNISGAFDNLNPSGFVIINDGDFVMDANNLEYNAGIRLAVNGKNVNIDSLLISNPRGTPGGGTMTGSGSALLDNMSPVSANILLTGDLKVMGDDSKEATPQMYGDLVIQSDGDIKITTTDFKRFFVNAPIIVREANLLFPMTQNGYQNLAENFIYRYPPDTSKNIIREQEFDKFIKLAKENNKKNKGETESSKIILDYSIKADVQNEAVLKFAFSRELNQNLTARIRGKIQFDNIGGKISTTGDLTLLDGSTLEMARTFDATGTIRFENDLTNPYLNIVGTYKNYYQPPEGDTKEELVAIKIKLIGPFSNLSQNFNKDKNNISVYVGSDNIDNNKPDDTKGPSDALYFIVTGQFASDLSRQQQSQAAGALRSSNTLSNTATSTATAVAGSLLGGLLNNYLGDAVRGVELKSVGQTTRFNLIGKVKNFNYTIGGSTDVFQDLSQANVKIEYPIFKSFLIRVERKEAITQNNTAYEMINELGLKYRFEF